LGMSASVGIPRTWSIVHWFHRLRGRALGIGSSGAVVSGPLLIIVVWLINTLGWQNAFVVLGVVTRVICIPLGLVFKSRSQELGYSPDGNVENPEIHPSTAPAGVQKPLSDNSFSVHQALRTQTFWLLTLVFSLQTMGISGMMVFLVPYFEGPDVGFNTTQAASVLGVFTLLSIFGRLGTGWAMDYWDQRLVLGTLLTSQATAFVLLANITAYWHIFPFAFLYGTAFGGMMPSRGFMVSSLFGTRNFGTIQGLMQSGTVLGGLIAPLLLGRSFDITNSYVPAIYFLAGVVALGIPIVLLLRPPRHD
ncbi:MFS transporter, partial [SAR202 cluster bacterium AD-802-E10_MRT_200m]|nr:MFS transporter [SAR202 cluster bacterium AD-802-E10_MRT_200m]